MFACIFHHSFYSCADYYKKNLAERNETKNGMAIWQLKKRQKVLFTSNSNMYKYINVNMPQDLKKGHKKLMLVE